MIVLDGEYKEFTPLESLMRQANKVGPKLQTKVPYFKLDPKTAVYTIIYTSGTTGLPKGAMISHYSLLYQVIQRINTSVKFMTSETIFCGNFPLAHASGQMFSIDCIISGAKMILIEVADTHKILDSVQKFKVFPCGLPFR